MRLQTLAPAKLNLCLYVGERRDDGLHELVSLFQAVTLADVLTLEASSGDEDQVVCHPEVDGPNLAAMALARFRERFAWEGQPVRVTIDKRIPVAAGLGGGSADAGAVLRLMVRASGVATNQEELQQLAMTIGADVPSQVEPGSYLVLGAGEVLERLQKPWHVSALLLTSDHGLRTAAVYERHDERGHGRRHLDRDRRALEEEITAAEYDPLVLRDQLVNDLEPAALELDTGARQALDLLWDSGAHLARLSGSGPTAFGLYRTAQEAEAAHAALAPRWAGGAHVVHHAPSDYAVVRSV
jgi:4-diphosphocytidyl-2-C-methyl-D-erythritol kinase